MACTYDWSFPGGVDAGGNGTSIEVVNYAASGAGTYTATLTMTMVDDPATPVDESTISDTQSVTFDAVVVNPVAPSPTFNVVGDGTDTITVTSADMPGDAGKAYLYWGDRKRDVTTAVAADFAAGMSHTFKRSGTYDIEVILYDAARERFDIAVQTVNIVVP